MTFKHKLSKRLALMRDDVMMFAAPLQPTFSRVLKSISLWLAPVMFTGLVLYACIGDQPINGPSFETITQDPTMLFQESFEDGAFAARGWYDNTSMVTTTVEHLPGSTRALELRYTAGATTPVAGGSARRQFPASPTVYVSYWVKYSSNWVGSGRAYHPHEFLIVSDQDGAFDGPSQSWLVAYVEHNYQNGGIPRLQLQDNKAINTSFGALPTSLLNLTESRSTSGCNGVVEANVVTTCFNMPPWYNDKEVHAPRVTFQPTAGAGYKGDWNHVEAYFALNSIAGGKGVADGVMQYWFNGELIIDRHDILFRTAARPTIQFDKFMIAPYIGDGSPVNQTMWVDDLTVAAGRIGSDQPPPLPPPSSTDPGTVTDLAVAAVTDSTVTLSFTEVSDGTGQPASYDVRFGAPAVAWGAAKDVALGTCKVPMAGATVGAKRSCTVRGLAPSTAYQFQLVAFRGTLNVDAVFGGLSNAVTGTTAAVAISTPTDPGTVTDLRVAAITDTSVTVAFTEVSDGTGLPARYLVRFATGGIAWGSAAGVTRGSCKVPMAGTTIGAKRTCKVLGLSARTSYQFQLVAFRGTLNVDAVFGELSNVASGTTAAPPAPVASVTLNPANTSLLVGATQQFAATLKDSAGNALSGRSVTWVSTAPTIATVSASGLVTAVGSGNDAITATSEGVSDTAPVAVSMIVTEPGTVADLAVATVTDTSVTLSFTEVSGGAGQPASYFARFSVAPLAWGSGTDVYRGTCKVPLAGSAIGAKRTCTVLGLAANTSYQFQLVAFRGTLNADAVFGGLSNVSSGTTTGSVVLPPPPPPRRRRRLRGVGPTSRPASRC